MWRGVLRLFCQSMLRSSEESEHTGVVYSMGIHTFPTVPPSLLLRRGWSHNEGIISAALSEYLILGNSVRGLFFDITGSML